MRVAVSADNSNGLDSVVSPHFGRCPCYVLVDLDGREVRRVDAVENPYYHQHVPGAVPDFIRDHGVDVMLTGGMGRRAIGFFQQYSIEAVTGAYGTGAIPGWSVAGSSALSREHRTRMWRSASSG
jgi:predicted Fe-Mo cluster-binding NifX family protein